MEGLAYMLDEHAVVHVRGTRSTGKTTLARLLYNHLKDSCRAVFIDTWDTKRSAFDNLVDKYHQSEYKDVEGKHILGLKGNDILFIVDEAERTYNSLQLWVTLIRARIDKVLRARFCLFSSYGILISGVPEYKFPDNRLACLQSVSLVGSTDSDRPNVCLFYTEYKFEDIVSRFYQINSVQFTLAQDLKGYIWSLTIGHPGMVDAILTFIEAVCTSNLSIWYGMTLIPTLLDLRRRIRIHWGQRDHAFARWE